MAETTTDNQGSTDGNTNGKTRAAMTPVEAITKISKILDQLSAADRKRVLTFVSETGE